MSRRRAFRPACPDVLEGRIAPSFAVPHVQALHGSTTSNARADVQSAPATKKSSVNWRKVGTQVTDFLGFTHHGKSHAKAHAPAHTLTR